MKVFIIGAGFTGIELARTLVAEKNGVVLIDRDSERCQDAARRFPAARVLCGDITDESLIEEERLADADLIAAVSGNHELNLVTAAYLRSRGVGKAVALTASAAYGDIARKLGIDVAVPVRDTVVDGIMSHLRGRSVQSVHSVCGNRFALVEGEVAQGARFAGLTLSEAARSSSSSASPVIRPRRCARRPFRCLPSFPRRVS